MFTNGWFHPDSCSRSPYKCGCRCRCPKCQLFDWHAATLDPVTGEPTDLARCRIYWECCADETGYVELRDASGVDYGVVPNVGSMGADDGQTYSLITTKPDCEARTLTLTMDNDCPCPVGCFPAAPDGLDGGHVSGATGLATITVSDWGTPDITFANGFSVTCQERRWADLAACNHTRTFGTSTLFLTRNINGKDVRCSIDYLEPFDPYLIGRIVYNRSLADGFNTFAASATYDVYGACTTRTIPNVGLTVAYGYYLYLVLVDHVTHTDVPICGSTRTVSARLPNDDIADNPLFTRHFFQDGGVLSTLAPNRSILGPTLFRIHDCWCSRIVGLPDNPNLGSEPRTIGTFIGEPFLGVAQLIPTVPGSFGHFQWESLA